MITIQWNMIEFSTHLTLWLFHGITTKILEMKPWHSFATKMSRLIGEILIRASITTTLSKITRVDYWTLISVWWVTRITMRVVLIWLLIFFFLLKLFRTFAIFSWMKEILYIEVSYSKRLSLANKRLLISSRLGVFVREVIDTTNELYSCPKPPRIYRIWSSLVTNSSIVEILLTIFLILSKYSNIDCPPFFCSLKL